MNKLFGLPFYTCKIHSSSYNKSEVVNTIIENYNLDNFRNFSTVFGSLHHEYKDKQNNKFKKINYSDLIPIYTKNIELFFEDFKFKKKWKFNFFISNYTAVNKLGQNMFEHLHSDCHFVAMHYISFDPSTHVPTLYRNPLALGQTNFIHYKNILDLYDLEDRSKVDWIVPTFSLDVEEDDFVITPSILEHQIPVLKNNTEKIRIVIACNIQII